ncbi:MAG: long-chain fatty acid--CoA ligase [Rhodospirillales bacterium]
MRSYPTWPNLAAMMFDRARTWPNRPMLRCYRNGAWHGINWSEFARMAASCARNLRAAGVSAGDRVLICSENRPEYPIAETALMAIRAVPVPAYTTNTVADHAHLLKDAGIRAAIVSNGTLAAKIAQAGELDLLVRMDDASWSDLVADTAPPDDIAAEATTIPPTALACLIYTSGTGGAPKGVMLPHRAILSNMQGAFILLKPLKMEDEVYLSYLPASHAYEHTIGGFYLPSAGTEIVYARGTEHLAADMLTIRPTIMTMVPRVLETIRARILVQLGRQKPSRQKLFHRALDLGLKRISGSRLTLTERILDPILDRLVRAKVRNRFGGRMIAVVSGGARLEPEVGRFFMALGLPVIQGYGQTEAGPIISGNPPDAIRVETVGTALVGVDLKLAEDGEILVRGNLVMDGYWGRPDDTQSAIQDGWLHTGDIGTLDRAGYLTITDRKKDMIVLSGGDNISPARIEGLLMGEPAIAQAVIAGDGRAAPIALLVPAEGFDDVAVAIAVSEVNRRLSVVERIRQHAVVEPFTVENGLLTPTLKIRRMLAIRANADALAKLHR